MSAPIKKAYVGSYGIFLDTVNKAESPLKPVVMEELNKHAGHMKMKDLIISLDAPISDLMDAITTLQSQKIISVSRQNNDEIIDII